MPLQIGRGRRSPGSRATRIAFFIVLGLVLLSTRILAQYTIEIEWWKELGQFRTQVPRRLRQRRPLAPLAPLPPLPAMRGSSAFANI